LREFDRPSSQLVATTFQRPSATLAGMFVHAPRLTHAAIAGTAIALVACSAPAAESPARPEVSADADVLAVALSGEPGGYQVDVTILSPDTGCGQYADWWELVRPDGTLVYRRILLHSHTDEQPFTRGGGPVALAAGDEVIVRAHMHPGGYGGQVLRGSADHGFREERAEPGFAAALEQSAPLPEGCAF
jgi:hypothetical protein